MIRWEIDAVGEIDICAAGAAYGEKNLVGLRDLLPAIRGIRRAIRERIDKGQQVWAVCEPHTFGILARFASRTGGEAVAESRIVRWGMDKTGEEK